MIVPAVERNDSNESNDSLGDIPIELRHLEGDFYDAELSGPDPLGGDEDDDDEVGGVSSSSASYFNSEMLKANILSLFGAGGQQEQEELEVGQEAAAAGLLLLRGLRQPQQQLMVENKSKSLDNIPGKCYLCNGLTSLTD